jgi:hypothetical protein
VPGAGIGVRGVGCMVLQDLGLWFVVCGLWVRISSVGDGPEHRPNAQDAPSPPVPDAHPALPTLQPLMCGVKNFRF